MSFDNQGFLESRSVSSARGFSRQEMKNKSHSLLAQKNKLTVSEFPQLPDVDKARDVDLW
jgi:hypothetical protein